MEACGHSGPVAKSCRPGTIGGRGICDGFRLRAGTAPSRHALGEPRFRVGRLARPGQEVEIAPFVRLQDMLDM